MTKQGVIKFQAPFEKMKEYDFSPEVRLHKSIILQAIIDASNNSPCPEARRYELEAKAWIFGRSQDFYNICHLSESNPEHVIKTAKKIIRLNNKTSFGCIMNTQNKKRKDKSSRL